MLSFQDWLVEAIDFYRELGFFDTEEDLSSFELATRIRAQLAEGNDESDFDPGEPGLDMALLTYDARRAFMASVDIKATPSSRAFIGFLNHLAGISRGRFCPESCAERWEGRKVLVSFQREAAMHQVSLPADGKLHRELLLEVNRSLLSTGYQFELAECVHDQSGALLFIALLAEQERFRVERERGLAFRIYDLGRLFRPLQQLVAPRSAPEGAFIGTVNEYFDRSVGRLELLVEGGVVSGLFYYSGRDHREELQFDGELQDGRVKGSIRGVVSTPSEGDADYLGDWTGVVHPGAGVLYGTWRGWLVDMAPEEAYSGQWGTVSAAALASDVPHLARVRQWLEEVWSASRPEDYPWMLP